MGTGAFLVALKFLFELTCALDEAAWKQDRIARDYEHQYKSRHRAKRTMKDLEAKWQREWEWALEEMEHTGELEMAGISMDEAADDWPMEAHVYDTLERSRQEKRKAEEAGLDVQDFMRWARRQNWQV